MDSLAAPPPVAVGEPRWRLRAAAVLRAFFKAADLAEHAQGAIDGISDDDLQSFVQLDCEPVNSARGTGWQLLPAVRYETVRHLGGDIVGCSKRHEVSQPTMPISGARWRNCICAERRRP